MVYIETIFKRQLTECLFCKEKIFGKYKNCPYCGVQGIMTPRSMR